MTWPVTTIATMPDWDAFVRVVTLQDYNTRVVLIGTMLLGMAAGIIGTFMLLRKRALMADALSHATWPGLGLAFLIATGLGVSGKSLPVLLTGAVVTGLLGMGCVLAIRQLTRLKEDAALGIVLSVFFGIGVAIFGIVQKSSTGNAAGLKSFVYGKTASMVASDAWMIAVAATLVTLAAWLLFKEFSLICFDQEYAGTQGWPVMRLDVIMIALLVGVTVIGLQAVGLILIVALLIIPPAAARFWTDRLHRMAIVAGIVGAASGLCGAALSALMPKLPAGAIIVLVAAGVFVVSLIFGPAGGLLIRSLRHYRLANTVRRQHLLRALYEWSESNDGMTWESLLAERSWSPAGLRRELRRCEREGLAYRGADGRYRLTELGASEAYRLVRNHRLWEMYLVTHADIAPSHVDRDADQLEHILGREMVAQLETLLAREHPPLAMPASPHDLKRGVSR